MDCVQLSVLNFGCKYILFSHLYEAIGSLKAGYQGVWCFLSKIFEEGYCNSWLEYKKKKFRIILFSAKSLFSLSFFLEVKKKERLNVQWADLSTHWWTLHRALLIWTNVTPRRSDSGTLSRTFSSCQRWSITLLTYTCTTHGLRGFTPASFCQADTRLSCCECRRTRAGDGLCSRWEELSCVLQSEAPARALVHPEEVRVARQVFIQLERDTMWWGFPLLQALASPGCSYCLGACFPLLQLMKHSFSAFVLKKEKFL